MSLLILINFVLSMYFTYYFEDICPLFNNKILLDCTKHKGAKILRPENRYATFVKTTGVHQTKPK